MENKKGMSLIVLVITIIVMIILSGVVIIGLTDNNPIEKAREATFKTDVGTYKEELNSTIINKKYDDRRYDPVVINETDAEEIKKYIPSFKKEYEGILIIEEGELVFDGGAGEYKEWSEDLGI